MSVMFTPADDVAANDFTGSRDKLAMGLLFGKSPCAIGIVDDVSVTDVFVEVPNTIVKANHARERQCTADGFGWKRRRAAVENEAIQTAFGDIFHHRQGTAGVTT